MIFKKHKFFLALLFALLSVILLAVGVSADDETPIVPIDPPDVTEIKLKTLPYKTQYLVGEKLDMSGAELELTYDTGAKGSAPVKLDWTTGFNSSKEGNQTLTITYPDTKCKTTFTVEVVSEKSLKVIAPKVVTYFVGDVEDRGGLSVSVVYSNGKSVELSPSDYTVKGFSTNTIGEKTITVTYKKLTATYNISVFEPALISLQIIKKPNKLSYYIGEDLDTSGMQIVAVYANGKNADVTSKVKVVGDISSSGVKTVTVSYTENDHMKSVTFQVTVLGVEIRNVVFASYPKKVSYLEGEPFDPTGISITVTYNNGKVETVSEGLLYTGFDSTTVGDKTVTLHYGSFQLNFTVSVSVSASHVHKESSFVTTLEPTCTKEGVKSTTCTVCFAIVRAESIAPTGHGNESMPVQIKAPNCTEVGATSTYCMVCGDAVTVTELPALGHTEGAPQYTVKPTCTTGGHSNTYCTVCRAMISSNDLSAYGHSFGDWTMKAEPTGESEGVEERVCATCSLVENNVIPRLVRTLKSGIFSAALGTAGYFPLYSNFYGERITDSLSLDDRLALTPDGTNGKVYEIVEVFDFAVVTSKGEGFIPSEVITFTVDYTLPYGEYSDFAVFDEDKGQILYFVAGEQLSIICNGNGRFVLVGEVIPAETASDSTTDATQSPDTEYLPVSGQDSAPKNHVLWVLIIIAIILVVIIAACIYAYVFKQYY